MSERRRYRCNNCGERFERDVLSPEEAEEALRRNEPTFPINCPACRRTDVREGWE